MPDTPNAVIVGHGPGIGAAVARAFAVEGYSIALLARDAGRLATAAASLPEAAGFVADVGREDSLVDALGQARARFGDPDVLVYNAAIWRPGPALSIGADEYEADYRVCVTGALVAARQVAPAMVGRGRGSILFTGGGLALHPSAMAPTLSLGKAALRALALVLAQELAPSGVRVGTVTVIGTVAPGTKFDPDEIAKAYLALHRSAPDPKTAETVFG